MVRQEPLEVKSRCSDHLKHDLPNTPARQCGVKGAKAGHRVDDSVDTLVGVLRNSARAVELPSRCTPTPIKTQIRLRSHSAARQAQDFGGSRTGTLPSRPRGSRLLGPGPRGGADAGFRRGSPAAVHTVAHTRTHALPLAAGSTTGLDLAGGGSPAKSHNAHFGKMPNGADSKLELEVALHIPSPQCSISHWICHGA